VRWARRANNDRGTEPTGWRDAHWEGRDRSSTDLGKPMVFTDTAAMCLQYAAGAAFVAFVRRIQEG